VSILWVLPLLIYAGGSVLLLSVTRRAADAGALLRAECNRLDEVRTALLQLRTETETARTGLDRLHSRSVSGGPRG